MMAPDSTTFTVETFFSSLAVLSAMAAKPRPRQW